jgi:hypothetical protein
MERIAEALNVNIATQLGVTQQTISNDLRDLQIDCKSKPAKTASNPKGAGRTM